MKKFLCTFFLCMLTAATLAVSAHAGEDVIKAGLYFGSSALYSANLQNYEGSGYALGWFDESTREFMEAGYLEEENICHRIWYHLPQRRELYLRPSR